MVRALFVVLVILALAPPAGADEPRGPLYGGVRPSEGMGARRLALCIGIDGYQHPAYPALRYAAADARLLARTFEDLGYEVTLMVDGDPNVDPELVPTRRNLDETIHRFCRSSTRPGDTLVICFAGHGDLVAGQSVLIPLDYHETDRAVTVGSLFDGLGRAQAAKKLLVLDACRSAGRDAGRRLQSGFLVALGQAENAVVLSGCGVNQSSYEDEALGHGRLTSCLVEGLRGAAFGPDREFLFGHELWGWVERTFHERKWAAQQSPTMFGVWDSRVRFDLARRDVDPPPQTTTEDREVFDLTMAKAVERSQAEDHTSAVKYSTTALRILPRHPTALARRAYAYLNLGYHDKAFQDAQAVLEQDADHPLALVIRVWLAFLAQNNELASAEVARLRAAFERTPERWRTDLPPDVTSAFWMSYAWTMGAMGGTDEAQMQGYEWALETDGAPPAVLAQALMLRGHLHTSRARFRQALADFTRIIELEGAPGHQVAYAYFNRAHLRSSLGTPEEVRADYEAALAQEGAPEDLTHQARWNLAMMDRAAGDEAAARDRYKRALASEDLPPQQRAWITLDYGRVLMAVVAYVPARILLESVVDLPGAPLDPVARAHANLGIIDFNLRRFDMALQSLNRCLESSAPPSFTHARALNVRGTVLEALGRPLEAEACYERVLSLSDPPLAELSEARLRAAILAHRQGRPDEALAWLEELFAEDIVAFEPRRIALTLRALIHAEAMREAEAKAALAETEGARYAMPGALALAWIDRARCVAVMRKPVEKAAEALEGTVALARPADAAWLDALGAVGRRDWEEAAALFRRAREVAPLPSVSVVWALGEYAMRTAEPPETTALYVWALTVGGGATVERADVDRWVEAHPDHPIAALLRAP